MKFPKTMSKLAGLAILFAAAMFAACSNGSDTIPSIEPNPNPTTITISTKTPTNQIPEDFVRGFDASQVSVVEGAGIKYLDANGKEVDVFTQLKNAGVNCVRLRIWNKPLTSTDKEKFQGGNNLEVTTALAKRAVTAGLDYMLDFHFSDTWADPTNQKCPSDWNAVTTVDDMKGKIGTFVSETLSALKSDAGAYPKYVQLGNECEGGILTSGTANDTVKGDISSHKENFVAYINAAAEKVRAAGSSIKIIMHTSRGGNEKVVKDFCNNISGIDYDIVGLSYYPFFTSHGNLESLKSNIKYINASATAKNKTAGNVKAMVCETSFCWTCDWTSGKSDDTNNQLWYYSENDGLVCAAKSLVDSSEKLVQGLTTTKVDDKGNKASDGTYTVIDPTVQNQYNAVAAVMDIANSAGALGVFYWGGDWLTKSGDGTYSAMENQAFWDYDHKALDSIKVFSFGLGTKNETTGGGESSGTIVKDISLASISSTAPGVTVAAGNLFTSLSESNTITVTVTCSAWSTTDNSNDTWFCYCIDGKSYKGKIETWESPNVSTTITGADITTLKSGSLTIYGNNKNATVTVTYK